jgi:hypothetical protein
VPPRPGAGIGAALGTLLKSDFIVINDLLADFYGIDGVKGEHFRKVAVPADSPRGGFLGSRVDREKTDAAPPRDQERHVRKITAIRKGRSSGRAVAKGPRNGVPTQRLLMFFIPVAAPTLPAGRSHIRG